MTIPPLCPICGFKSQLLHSNLEDKLFHVALRTTFYRCTASSCQHLFAAPAPMAEQLPSLYAQYSTHQYTPLLAANRKSRWLEIVTTIFGSVDDLKSQIRRWRVMDMADRRGAVLDIGCGSGNLLSELRSLGLSDLTGIDFDPKAVSAARDAGLNVIQAEVNDLERRDFDVALMNHVIEHVISPVQFLRQALNHLAVGGLLVIRTPNSTSFLSKLFGKNWRGLEPPRHINVFSHQSLQRACAQAGFTVTEIGSTNSMLQGIYLESVELRLTDMNSLYLRFCRIALRLAFPLVVFIASVTRKINPFSGEELFAVVRKDDI